MNFPVKEPKMLRLDRRALIIIRSVVAAVVQPIFFGVVETLIGVAFRAL